MTHVMYSIQTRTHTSLLFMFLFHHHVGVFSQNCKQCWGVIDNLTTSCVFARLKLSNGKRELVSASGCNTDIEL